MSKAPVDWIVACDGTDPAHPMGIECTRCGNKDIIGVPILVDAFIARINGFVDGHKHCQSKGARQ